MDDVAAVEPRPHGSPEVFTRGTPAVPAGGPSVLYAGAEAADREAVSAFLRREGFDVCVVTSGAEALATCGCEPSVVLLEAMLADMSGLEVCRRIRTRSGVPIVVVTGGKHDPVTAFDAGADDCVSKPVRPRELVARLRAAMRRIPERLSEPVPPAVVQGGNVHLDAARCQVTVARRPVYLPVKEFALLEFLLQHDGQVVRREAILERVWGPHWTGGSKTLDAHVSRLRQRLAEAGASASVTTIRGLGYLYETLLLPSNVVVLDRPDPEADPAGPELDLSEAGEVDVLGRSVNG